MAETNSSDLSLTAIDTYSMMSCLEFSSLSKSAKELPSDHALAESLASESNISSCVSLTRLNSIPTHINKSELNRLLKDRLFVDFFNVFLNLPIFPQRVLYDHVKSAFIFDPPVFFGTESNDIPNQLLSSLGSWIIDKRYNYFLNSDLFWEYQMCVDLLSPEPFNDPSTFTALSCSKFIYDCIASAVSMKKFKAHIYGTPGERIFKSLRDLDRFTRVPLDHPERLAKFQVIRSNILAIRSEDGYIFFPNEESCGASDIDMGTLDCIRQVLFFTVKVYWLPRYLLDCSKLGSKRRLRLEKEIVTCRKLVGRFLMSLPNLTKYELIQECYDSILRKPLVSDHNPGDRVNEVKKPHKKKTSSEKFIKSSDLIDRLLPGQPAVDNTDRRSGSADVCVCIQPYSYCTCNQAMTTKELTERIDQLLPSVLKKPLSNKEKESAGKTVLSNRAFNLFTEISSFYKENPNLEKSLTLMNCEIIDVNGGDEKSEVKETSISVKDALDETISENNFKFEKRIEVRAQGKLDVKSHTVAMAKSEILHKYNAKDELEGNSLTACLSEQYTKTARKSSSTASAAGSLGESSVLMPGYYAARSYTEQDKWTLSGSPYLMGSLRTDVDRATSSLSFAPSGSSRTSEYIEMSSESERSLNKDPTTIERSVPKRKPESRRHDRKDHIDSFEKLLAEQEEIERRDRIMALRRAENEDERKEKGNRLFPKYHRKLSNQDEGLSSDMQSLSLYYKSLIKQQKSIVKKLKLGSNKDSITTSASFKEFQRTFLRRRRNQGSGVRSVYGSMNVVFSLQKGVFRWIRASRAHQQNSRTVEIERKIENERKESILNQPTAEIAIPFITEESVQVSSATNEQRAEKEETIQHRNEPIVPPVLIDGVAVTEEAPIIIRSVTPLSPPQKTTVYKKEEIKRKEFKAPSGALKAPDYGLSNAEEKVGKRSERKKSSIKPHVEHNKKDIRKENKKPSQPLHDGHDNKKKKKKTEKKTPSKLPSFKAFTNSRSSLTPASPRIESRSIYEEDKNADRLWSPVVLDPVINSKRIKRMKDLHNTDSLLHDLDVHSKRHTESREISDQNIWKSKIPLPSACKCADKLPDIYISRWNKEPEMKSYDYMSTKLRQDSSFMSGFIRELAGFPVMPDVDVLQRDIFQATEDRLAAGDALPVIPGTAHINKLIFPAGPNVTVWNYIIQRYDTVSRESYRVQHRIYLLSIKSDRFAGSPFAHFLKERNRINELIHYSFWKDAETFLTELVKGKTSNQYRLRFGKEMAVNYLMANSQYRVSLHPEIKDIVLYALQMDEADEILKYCQDYCIELCREEWKLFIKSEQKHFNKYLSMVEMHAEVTAVKLIDSEKNDADQYPVMLKNLEAGDCKLPLVRPIEKGRIPVEIFSVLLSADPGFLKMKGNNRPLMSYFSNVYEHTGKDFAILPNKEVGLIAVDITTMNAAFDLACTADDHILMGEVDPEFKQKGSMFMISRALRKSKNTLPDWLRGDLGLNEKKSISQLRIARCDIENGYTDVITLKSKRRKSAKPLSEHLMKIEVADSHHGEKKGRIAHKMKASKLSIPIWMDPILINGRLVARPIRKPQSLYQVLMDGVYRAFFLKYLESCNDSWPLRLYIDCQDIADTKAKILKLKKLEMVNKLHFEKPSLVDEEEHIRKQCEKYRICDPMFKEIIRMEKMELGQVSQVIKMLMRYLEEKWFQEFRESFPDVVDSESQSNRVAEIAKNNELISLWKRYCWIIIDFYRGLKTSQIRNRFLKYLRYNDQKATASLGQSGGTAQEAPKVNNAASKAFLHQNTLTPSPSKVNYSKSPLNTATSRASMYNGNGSVNSREYKKPLSEKEKDKSKYVHDALFILESGRYVRVVRNVKANEALILPPRDDFVYVKAKAKAIVERFIDSEVPPKLQVNIANHMADVILKNYKTTVADIRLFADAEHSMIFHVLDSWKKFLKSFWYDSSATKLASPAHDVKFLVHNTIKYDYLLTGSTGDLEHAKIVVSVEHGIKQYSFVLRSPSNAQHSLAPAKLVPNSTTQRSSGPVPKANADGDKKANTKSKPMSLGSNSLSDPSALHPKVGILRQS